MKSKNKVLVCILAIIIVATTTTTVVLAIRHNKQMDYTVEQTKDSTKNTPNTDKTIEEYKKEVEQANKGNQPHGDTSQLQYDTKP